jgi:hypothetical protein
MGHGSKTMEKIALDPEGGIELQVFLATCDGYVAGMKAGIEAAKQIRIDQIVKAHRAKSTVVETPTVEPGDAPGLEPGT